LILKGLAEFVGSVALVGKDQVSDTPVVLDKTAENIENT